MAISEELKQRIENFGMGRRSPRGSMQMGVSGKGATDSIQMGSMMEMARETKGAISNKDLEILNQASS